MRIKTCFLRTKTMSIWLKATTTSRKKRNQSRSSKSQKSRTMRLLRTRMSSRMRKMRMARETRMKTKMVTMMCHSIRTLS